MLFFFFFFNDTATTEIYTLSLHDALPICQAAACAGLVDRRGARGRCAERRPVRQENAELVAAVSVRLDRKSTRLNSSHLGISYAVFCLKKKKNNFLLIRNQSTWLGTLIQT